MSAPLITVLMPVYNAERFLKEAIDSILQQTLTDFEFLIIDDGSSDTSVDIVKEYKDPRIRFVQNEKNMGISYTLNSGINLAASDIIARMDADDISYTDRLAKQYQYMIAHPDCALLSTWARIITEDKKFIRLERYRSNFYYYNLTFECWIYHPTIMFRRKPIQDVGMYSMPYSEDYDLFWKVSTRFLIGNLAEPLVDYRLSATSLNMVLRKEEYERANEQNVLRNIRHYMGPDFTLTKEALECLRHNFIPILSLGSVKTMRSCLDLLDAITKKILEKDNVNRDAESIWQARFFKRRFMITELLKGLPLQKTIILLFSVGTTELWIGWLKSVVKTKINR
jgi:glycosyltransferase involved in cell wall biosynthesis